MKFQRLFREDISALPVDPTEELIKNIKSKYKTASYSFELELDDSTSINFNPGNLKRKINDLDKTGLSVESVKATAVYAPRSGKDRVILAEVNNKYKYVSLSVGARGAQTDIDWARSAFDSIKGQISNTFPLVRTELPKQKTMETSKELAVKIPKEVSLSPNKYASFDWKWWLGTLLTIILIIIGWLTYETTK